MFAMLNGNDGHLHWTEVPNPVIKEDEVLLDVYAAGINRADLLQRAGQYPPPKGWPDWFGLEASGVIAAVGENVKKEGKWKIIVIYNSHYVKVCSQNVFDIYIQIRYNNTKINY